MEKIYSEPANTCNNCRVSKKTVDFLLQYSKSLHIMGYKDFKFETTLN